MLEITSLQHLSHKTTFEGQSPLYHCNNFFFKISITAVNIKLSVGDLYWVDFSSLSPILFPWYVAISEQSNHIILTIDFSEVGIAHTCLFSSLFMRVQCSVSKHVFNFGGRRRLPGTVFVLFCFHLFCLFVFLFMFFHKNKG